MVIPKVWYSLESKTTLKFHLGILSNTSYAHTQLTCKIMHEHVKILPKIHVKMPLGANTNTIIKKKG